MDKKTQLLAQFFISIMMAAFFSGFFTLINLGLTGHWLMAWPRQFAVAWPVAFTLSLFVGPVGFKLARMTRRRFASKVS